MSTLERNHSNAFSPVLLSPSSANHGTIANHHLPIYDNSDQGSVDSDYTSLSSSKFYGHGGSTSSLSRQGRSQSIDELAATSTTTTIPTRHFNGVLNVHKSNNDPLQFVKIHPNLDLIERAQEQLTIAESRKRFRENEKYSVHHQKTVEKSGNKLQHESDGDVDWSKAVENWRQKREQKRKQSLNSNRLEDEPATPPAAVEPPPPPPPSTLRPIQKFQVSETKPPPAPVAIPPPANNVIEQLVPQRVISKSPSPQRVKGPSKVHEVSIEKPVEIRGFGFKLEAPDKHHRSVYISTIEDGSLADKAGLFVDDEVLAMNGENIENVSFDQVRKILKERNLRGSIKLLVRTYEDIHEDNSQTVTTAATTEHSRTPSPQKVLSSSSSTPIVPSSSITINNLVLTGTMSTSTPSNKSPVYTFLPTPLNTPTQPPPPPPPPPIPPTIDVVNHQTPPVTSNTPTLNIFAPKPFRTAASINLDGPNQTDTVKSSDGGQTTMVSKPTVQVPTERPPLTSSTTTTTSSNQKTITESFSSIKLDTKPAPLSSVESLLHGVPDRSDSNEQRYESPMAQVRSSVEQQMNKLQQELLSGFSQPSVPPNETKREQRSVNIPIDFTNAALPRPSILKSSTSDGNHVNQTDRNSLGKTTFHEQQTYQTESSTTQRVSSSNYSKRPIQDPPMSNRAVNELRINVSAPYSNQLQEKFSSEFDNKIPQERMSSKQLHTILNQVPKRSNYEDQSWINENQRKLMAPQPSPPPIPPLPPSYVPSHNISGHTTRRPAPVPPTQTAPPQLTMFHYGDHPDEQQYFPNNVEQHRNPPAKLPPRSPIRTTINSNNNRVLSVSGKLRCSRCQDELGQGSAMVIESLGLYYHIECFRCYVCNIPLSSSFEGTDVRVRNNRLHCQNCFSDDNGAWRSNV